MLIDTDRLRERLKDIKTLKAGHDAIWKFATWARTAEATRAMDIIEDFWVQECGDIKEAMERDGRLCTRVFKKLGIEEFSRDECLFASGRFWKATRRVYEYFLIQVTHVTRIIKDHFNWSRHP